MDSQKGTELVLISENTVYIHVHTYIQNQYIYTTAFQDFTIIITYIIIKWLHYILYAVWYRM